MTRRAVGQTLLKLAQRVDGGDGSVEVQLDNLEPGDADVESRGLVELGVRLHHAGYQRFYRRAHCQVGRGVVAEQQRGERQLPIGFAQHVDRLEQVAQRAGAHCLGQRLDAQGAVVLAQTGNDRTAQAAPGTLGRVRCAQHHDRCAARASVEAEAVALAQITVEELAVDQGFGSCDRVLLVVAHHNRYRQEAEIDGLDGHFQPPLRSRRNSIA